MLEVVNWSVKSDSRKMEGVWRPRSGAQPAKHIV
jgi:hypothetical protein